MATRRRIGVSAATTEAARRQLMQPVPCWEQKWTNPDPSTGATSFKILKWVKTDKIQQFSDEEGEADEPLAPLPDEPEVVDGDEEGDLDDAVANGTEGAVSRGEESTEASTTKDQQDLLLSKPPSPKPGPRLSISLAVDEEPTNNTLNDDTGTLDVSLNPFDGTMDEVDDVGEKLDGEDMMELDMSSLAPPDGSDFVGNLDEILGGSMMGQTDDPFAEQEDP